MATAAARTFPTRLVQLAALAALVTLAGLTMRLTGAAGAAGQLFSVGLLLLTGTLLSELLESVGLPHLTGYLAAGAIIGPHGLDVVQHDMVRDLGAVNTLALALIALAGGVELRWSAIRTSARSLTWAMSLQTGVVFAVCGLSLFAVASRLPFLGGMGFRQVAAAAILWGVLSVSRSPSASLAILSQTRARGPIASFTLAFVMASDVIVLVLLALALPLVRQLLHPEAPLSVADFALLGHELVSSVSLGTTLGLLLIVYLATARGSLFVPLIVVAYGLNIGLQYLRFDPLLTFLVAGFVVRNLSRQGKRLAHGIHQLSSLVFVVFFGLAGAHLDLTTMKTLWPLALGLCLVRAGATWGAQRVASKRAGDPAPIRDWGWSGLVSQAGLTLGISVLIERAFPWLGHGLHSLVIATVAGNEVVGPILFKWALDRNGESRPELSEAATPS